MRSFPSHVADVIAVTSARITTRVASEDPKGSIRIHVTKSIYGMMAFCMRSSHNIDAAEG